MDKLYRLNVDFPAAPKGYIIRVLDNGFSQIGAVLIECCYVKNFPHFFSEVSNESVLDVDKENFKIMQSRTDDKNIYPEGMYKRE